MSARTDFVALLTGNLPAGTQVYNHGADLIKLPAVVVQPGDPWLEYSALAAGGSAYTVRLEVICQVKRTTQVAARIAELETLVDAVMAAVTPSAFKLDEAAAPASVTTGDVEAIGSTLTFYSRLQGGLA